MSADDVVLLVFIDSEYEGMFPRLSGAEFESLKASIAEHGLFHKIVVNEDLTLLDGHSRRECLRQLGIPVTANEVEIKHFESKLDERIFVCMSNIQRRHLTDFERVELAIPLEELVAEKARLRMSDGGKGVSFDAPLITKDEVAKAIGVSPATYQRARKIRDHGTSEERAEARSGKRMVSRVYAKILKRERHPETIDVPLLIEKAEKSIDSAVSRLNLLYEKYGVRKRAEVSYPLLVQPVLEEAPR